jgi:hypothetical protein
LLAILLIKMEISPDPCISRVIVNSNINNKIKIEISPDPYPNISSIY